MCAAGIDAADNQDDPKSISIQSTRHSRVVFDALKSHALEQYLEIINQSEEEFLAKIRDESRQDLQRYVVIEEIAPVDGIGTYLIGEDLFLVHIVTLQEGIQGQESGSVEQRGGNVAAESLGVLVESVGTQRSIVGLHKAVSQRCGDRLKVQIQQAPADQLDKDQFLKGIETALQADTTKQKMSYYSGLMYGLQRVYPQIAQLEGRFFLWHCSTGTSRIPTP